MDNRGEKRQHEIGTKRMFQQLKSREPAEIDCEKLTLSAKPVVLRRKPPQDP